MPEPESIMSEQSVALSSYLKQILSRFDLITVSKAAQRQLAMLFSGSSFIARTLQQQPQLLAEFSDNAALIAALQLNSSVPPQLKALDEAAAFTQLRQYRNAQLCRILAADILQLQDITESLLQVSQVADL